MYLTLDRFGLYFITCSPGLGAEKQHKIVSVTGIELVDDALTVRSRGRAVQSQGGILVERAQLSKKVKYLSRDRDDDDLLLARGAEPVQQVGDDGELAALLLEGHGAGVEALEGALRDLLVEEAGVVADLAELQNARN